MVSDFYSICNLLCAWCLGGLLLLWVRLVPGVAVCCGAEVICCCSGRDSYLMWLYGVVLKQLGQRRLAQEVLCWAVHLAPQNWAAWTELAELIVKRSKVR